MEQIISITTIEMLRGILSLIFVITSFSIGFKVMTKYAETRQKQLISVGLTWVFLSSPWWGGVFAFLFYVFFSVPLPPQIYLFLGNFFIPVALITWIYSFSALIYPEIRKKIFYPYLAIGIGLLAFISLALIFDYTIIGFLESELNSKHSIISLLIIVLSLLSLIVSGTIFALRSMRGGREQKWRGSFLLLAFIVFSLGAIFDAVAPTIPLLLVLIKGILVLSGFLYYLGFFLPKGFRKYIQQKVKDDVERKTNQ
jgi:hypothetical protein